MQKPRVPEASPNVPVYRPAWHESNRSEGASPVLSTSPISAHSWWGPSPLPSRAGSPVPSTLAHEVDLARVTASVKGEIGGAVNPPKDGGTFRAEGVTAPPPSASHPSGQSTPVRSGIDSAIHGSGPSGHLYFHRDGDHSDGEGETPKVGSGGRGGTSPYELNTPPMAALLRGESDDQSPSYGLEFSLGPKSYFPLPGARGSPMSSLNSNTPFNDVVPGDDNSGGPGSHHTRELSRFAPAQVVDKSMVVPPPPTLPLITIPGGSAGDVPPSREEWLYTTMRPPSRSQAEKGLTRPASSGADRHAPPPKKGKEGDGGAPQRPPTPPSQGGNKTPTGTPGGVVVPGGGISSTPPRKSTSQGSARDALVGPGEDLTSDPRRAGAADAGMMTPPRPPSGGGSRDHRGADMEAGWREGPAPSFAAVTAENANVFGVGKIFGVESPSPPRPGESPLGGGSEGDSAKAGGREVSYIPLDAAKGALLRLLTGSEVDRTRQLALVQEVEAHYARVHEASTGKLLLVVEQVRSRAKARIGELTRQLEEAREVIGRMRAEQEGLVASQVEMIDAVAAQLSFDKADYEAAMERMKREHAEQVLALEARRRAAAAQGVRGVLADAQAAGAEQAARVRELEAELASVTADRSALTRAFQMERVGVMAAQAYLLDRVADAVSADAEEFKSAVEGLRAQHVRQLAKVSEARGREVADAAARGTALAAKLEEVLKERDAMVGDHDRAIAALNEELSVARKAARELQAGFHQRMEALSAQQVATLEAFAGRLADDDAATKAALMSLSAQHEELMRAMLATQEAEVAAAVQEGAEGATRLEQAEAAREEELGAQEREVRELTGRVAAAVSAQAAATVKYETAREALGAQRVEDLAQLAGELVSPGERASEEEVAAAAALAGRVAERREAYRLQKQELEEEHLNKAAALFAERERIEVQMKEETPGSEEYQALQAQLRSVEKQIAEADLAVVTARSRLLALEASALEAVLEDAADTSGKSEAKEKLARIKARHDDAATQLEREHEETCQRLAAELSAAQSQLDRAVAARQALEEKHEGAIAQVHADVEAVEAGRIGLAKSHAEKKQELLDQHAEALEELLESATAGDEQQQEDLKSLKELHAREVAHLRQQHAQEMADARAAMDAVLARLAEAVPDKQRDVAAQDEAIAGIREEMGQLEATRRQADAEYEAERERLVAQQVRALEELLAESELLQGEENADKRRAVMEQVEALRGEHRRQLAELDAAHATRAEALSDRQRGVEQRLGVSLREKEETERLTAQLQELKATMERQLASMAVPAAGSGAGEDQSDGGKPLGDAAAASSVAGSVAGGEEMDTAAAGLLGKAGAGDGEAGGGAAATDAGGVPLAPVTRPDLRSELDAALQDVAFLREGKAMAEEQLQHAMAQLVALGGDAAAFVATASVSGDDDEASGGSRPGADGAGEAAVAVAASGGVEMSLEAQVAYLKMWRSGLEARLKTSAAEVGRLQAQMQAVAGQGAHGQAHGEDGLVREGSVARGSLSRRGSARVGADTARGAEGEEGGVPRDGSEGDLLARIEASLGEVEYYRRVNSIVDELLCSAVAEVVALRVRLGDAAGDAGAGTLDSLAESLGRTASIKEGGGKTRSDGMARTASISQRDGSAAYADIIVGDDGGDDISAATRLEYERKLRARLEAELKAVLVAGASMRGRGGGGGKGGSARPDSATQQALLDTQARLQEALSELSSARAEVERLEGLLADANGEMEAARDQAEMLQEQVSQQQDAATALEARVAQLEESLAAVQADKDQLDTLAQTLAQEKEAALADAAAAQQQVAGLAEELQEREERLDALAEMGTTEEDTQMLVELQEALAVRSAGYQQVADRAAALEESLKFAQQEAAVREKELLGELQRMHAAAKMRSSAQYQAAEAELAELADKKAGVEAKLKYLAADLKKKMAVTSSASKEQRRRAIDECNERIAALDVDKRQLLIQMAAVQETMDALLGAQTQLEKELDEAKNTAMEKEREDFEARIARLEADVRELTLERDELMEENEQLHMEIKVNTQDVRGYKESLANGGPLPPGVVALMATPASGEKGATPRADSALNGSNYMNGSVHHEANGFGEMNGMEYSIESGGTPASPHTPGSPGGAAGHVLSPEVREFKVKAALASRVRLLEKKLARTEGRLRKYREQGGGAGARPPSARPRLAASKSMRANGRGSGREGAVGEVADAVTSSQGAQGASLEKRRIVELEMECAAMIKKVKKLETEIAEGTAFEEAAARERLTAAERKKEAQKVKAMEDRIAELEAAEAAHGRQLAAVESERDVARRDAAAVRAELDAIRAEEEAMKAAGGTTAEMEAATREIRLQMKALEEVYKKEVTLRKKLYNQIQDMKGKIRVYCRVRPISKTESARGNFTVVSSVDEFSIDVAVKGTDGKVVPKSFQFDQVFMPDAAQEAVFENVKFLCQSAVDGFNVCIFAYGQTGSGKTFTMAGTPQMPGIQNRAISEIFSLIEQNSASLAVTVKLYMLELYNDNLMDLLLPASVKDRPKLDLKKDERTGLMTVAGAVVVECKTEFDVRSAIEQGTANRHTAATLMNAESSRSHLVFTLLMETENKKTGARSVGKLSLVDLAGSERLAKTGAEGDRLKEAQSINKSLSALGNVIAALSTNAAHVPYRDSKLTLLMSDSLGGNAKTLMFVNVSPVDYNTDETINSLMYASRVKLITNKAEKNTDNKEVQSLKLVIAAQREAMEKAGIPPIY
eukprot:jgi/Mesvir1/13402/Mv16489-RA.1